VHEGSPSEFCVYKNIVAFAFNDNALQNIKSGVAKIGVRTWQGLNFV
jgi:hypothetical protein